MRSVADIFRSYAVFDAEGRHVNGTDKQSNHRYGDAYESLFIRSTDFAERNQIRLMMEIGIADGSSLLAWLEVFPNALCVGMDIHEARRVLDMIGSLHESGVRYPESRLEFHIGDQRSREDCERAADGRMFDLIVEDATHRLEDTLVTLLYLWPFVKPGGLYVIEEFCDIGGLRRNVESLFGADVVDTVGPSGGIEPLVVLRKPQYGPSPLRGAYSAWKQQPGYLGRDDSMDKRVDE